MAASRIKTGCVVLLAVFFTYAEVRVFLDESFPYRIVCKPEWNEALKNDSTLILDKISTGTKTRFQLKKYVIDTTFNRETNEWSRLNFAINKELAVNFGKLVFVDTGAAKKLGDYRAFEMFAFFSESTETQKVWWAEYCRWTDHDGYGFLASIIGDTIEMKQNYATYKTFLDSISVSRMHTEVLWREKVAGLRVSRDQSPRSPPDHDLLGRSIPSSIKKNNQVLVGKKIQQCQIR
jgi:hypothetical protein